MLQDISSVRVNQLAAQDVLDNLHIKMRLNLIRASETKTIFPNKTRKQRTRN